MAQDVRNHIIAENVPKLIESILCSEIGNANYRICENLAWNHLKFNRYISTNSHAVRRKIEELIERFNIENMPEFANYINMLFNKLIEHPLCMNHYEIDIQWSLIDFLISIAYQPIASIRRDRAIKDKERDLNMQRINADSTKPEDNTKNSELQLVVFKECIDLKVYDCHEDKTDDLSDWSDHETNCQQGQLTPFVAQNNKNTTADEQNIPQGPKGYFQSNYKPPVFPKQFRVYESSNILQNKVNGCWWNERKQYVSIENKSAIANFAIAYAQYLNKISFNLITFNLPSTIPEFYLLREIIVMFYAPVNCKFFKLINNEVVLCTDVTIPRVTLKTLRTYLQGKILKPLRQMQDINRMLQDYEYSKLSSRTLSLFTASIRLLLKPINQKLIDFEQQLLEQKEDVISTLMSFDQWMRNSFKQLNFLHSIVKLTSLSCLESRTHLKSMFLLSKLYNFMITSNNNTTVVALFLVTFKVYCIILDMWWHGGCLQDWNNEFVAKHSLDPKSTIVLRELDCAKASCDANEVIRKCPLYQLLCKYSLDTGMTNNLLAEMDLTNKMLENCRTPMQQPLHDELVIDILNALKKNWYSDNKDEHKNIPPYDTTMNEQNDFSDLNYLNTIQDEHLLGAFLINLTTDSSPKKSLESFDVIGLSERLSNCKLSPPLYVLFYDSLTRLLTKRVDTANQFVMRLYLKDLCFGAHVQHIRNVILLQANSFMYFFYDQLFQKIESNKPWANSASLSMQLDGIISAYMQEKPALIQIEVRSKLCSRKNKVCEVADDISLIYELNPALSCIITPDNIASYNKIFRMLLKTKWAVWKLEHLRFAMKQTKYSYGTLRHIDFLMRRLEQLRFWLIYVIGSLHFHFCNELFVIGQQFDDGISNCKDLTQLRQFHQSYLNAISQRCLIADSFSEIRFVLDQFFHLICVVDMEWQSCTSVIENSYALSLYSNDSDSISSNVSIEEYLDNNTIDELEQTYVRCHQLLATLLNNEVTKHGRNYLYGLDNCFSSSLPY